MIKFKFIKTLLLLLLCANCICLSQVITENSNQNYKVINIDSTENYYFIFISKVIYPIDSKITTLDKSNDCGYTLSFNNLNPEVSCIMSEKLQNFKRNIYVGDTFNFVLKQVFVPVKTFSSGQTYTHIGFGDYFEDSQRYLLLYSDEVLGLFYTENFDMIKVFHSQREQISYFDSQMLQVWMNFAHSKMCYSKWLKRMIVNTQQIEISDVNNSFILYEDIDCIIPVKSIKIEDFRQNGIIKVRLYYQNKHHAFVQIGDSFYSNYGWVKIKQKKNSNYFILKQ